jgi:hypothetical protein
VTIEADPEQGAALGRHCCRGGKPEQAEQHGDEWTKKRTKKRVAHTLSWSSFLIDYRIARRQHPVQAHALQ